MIGCVVILDILEQEHLLVLAITLLCDASEWQSLFSLKIALN